MTESREDEINRLVGWAALDHMDREVHDAVNFGIADPLTRVLFDQIIDPMECNVLYRDVF